MYELACHALHVLLEKIKSKIDTCALGYVDYLALQKSGRESHEIYRSVFGPLSFLFAQPTWQLRAEIRP